MAKRGRTSPWIGAIVISLTMFSGCFDQSPAPNIVEPNGVNHLRTRIIRSEGGDIAYKFYSGQATFAAWRSSMRESGLTCERDPTPVIWDELSCNTNEFLIGIYPSSEFRATEGVSLPVGASWVVEYAYLG